MSGGRHDNHATTGTILAISDLFGYDTLTIISLLTRENRRICAQKGQEWCEAQPPLMLLLLLDHQLNNLIMTLLGAIGRTKHSECFLPLQQNW